MHSLTHIGRVENLVEDFVAIAKKVFRGAGAATQARKIMSGTYVGDRHDKKYQVTGSASISHSTLHPSAPWGLDLARHSPKRSPAYVVAAAIDALGLRLVIPARTPHNAPRRRTVGRRTPSPR